MGFAPIYLTLAALTLTACASGNTAGTIPTEDNVAYQEPYPFSENQEAEQGYKAYDEQTRALNDANAARH